MSGSSRPTGPHLSTSFDGRSDRFGRVPSRATSSDKWPIHPQPNPLDPRKRSLPRSRGNSPPDKRSRLPSHAGQHRAHQFHERRLSTHPNHNQPTESATHLASASPQSRHGSTAGLPVNIPRGLRQERSLLGLSEIESDQFESNEFVQTSVDKSNLRKQSTDHSPLHLPSPRSNGSGATTPVNAAPQAPSMVPVSNGAQTGERIDMSSTAVTAERAEWTHPNGVPYSPSMVQKIKAKKKAMAAEAKNVAASEGESFAATISPALQVQIKALQMENAALKNDKDDILNRLQALENRLCTTVDATEPAIRSRDQSKQLEGLETRLKILETVTLSPGMPTLPESDWKLESIPDQIKAIIDKASNQEKELGKIKTDAKEAAKATNTVIDLSRQVRTSLQSSKDVIQREVHAATQKVHERLETHQRTMTKHSSRIKECLDFIDSIEKARVLDQVQILDEVLRNSKQDMDNSRKDAERAQNEVMSLREDIRKYVGPLKEYSTNKNQSTIIQSIAELARKIKDLQTKQCTAKTNAHDSTEDLSKFKRELADLSEGLTKAEKGMDDISALRKNLQSRMEELETIVRATSSGTFVNPDSTSEDLVGKEEFYYTMQALNSNIASVSDALGAAERNVHDNAGDIYALRNDVPFIFEQSLKEYKAETGSKVDKLTADLNATDMAITLLKQEASKPSESVEKLQEKYAEDFKGLQDRIDSKMRELLSAEANQRAQSIREMNDRIATRAEAAAVASQMEQHRMGFRDLEERYNNITTEHLHKRMVEWFVQNYPGTPAHLMIQFQSLKQDVDKLKATSSRTATPQAQQPEIAILVKNAHQIEELVNSRSEPQSDPQVLARLDEAHTNAQVALERINQAQPASELQARQIESILKCVTGLQTSFRNLNATDSPFVRIQELRDLQNGWTNFQSLVNSALDTERDARIASSNELRTSAGRANDARIKAESSLRTQIDGHAKRLDDRLSEISEDWSTRSDALETATDRLRTDFDNVNNTLIQPNRDMYGMFDQVVVVLGQLQEAVEGINQKLPSNPLKLKWAVNLWQEPEQPVQPVQQEEAEVPRSQERAGWKGKEKRKGKSRQ